MSQPTYERLVTQLDRLGLWRVKESLPEALQSAEQKGPGYAAFLDRLLEEEIAAREERRIKNALRLSGLPFLKTLDSFDFAFQPSLDRAQVMDLASLTFLAQRQNVLLLGPPGVGKTHLAVALAVHACQNGYSVYFTTLDAMIRGLAAADRAGRLDGKLRTYTTKSQLLVLDEEGAEAPCRTMARTEIVAPAASGEAARDRFPGDKLVGDRRTGKSALSKRSARAPSPRPARRGVGHFSVTNMDHSSMTVDRGWGLFNADPWGVLHA
jgi:hypothetical protein